MAETLTVQPPQEEQQRKFGSGLLEKIFSGGKKDAQGAVVTEASLGDAATEITGAEDKLPGLGQEGVQPAAVVEEFRAEEAATAQVGEKTDQEWKQEEAFQAQVLKEAEEAFAQTEGAKTVEPVIGAEMTPTGQPVESLNGLPPLEAVKEDMAPKVDAVIDAETAVKQGGTEAAVKQEAEVGAEAEITEEKPENDPKDVAQVREIQMNWLEPRMKVATGQEKAALTALNGFLEAYSTGGYNDLADIKTQLAENGYQWIEEPVLNEGQQPAADLAEAKEEVVDMAESSAENPPEPVPEVISARPEEITSDLAGEKIAVEQESLDPEAEFGEMFDRLFGPGMEMGELTEEEKQKLVAEMTENARKVKERQQQLLDEADEILAKAAEKEAATKRSFEEAAAILAELKEKEKQNKVA